MKMYLTVTSPLANSCPLQNSTLAGCSILSTSSPADWWWQHTALGDNDLFKDIYSAGFDYLLCSLATRGFVAVSVKSGVSADERALIIRLHLRWLVEKVTVTVGIKGISTKPLVLIGHSEAGGSVVKVASQISSGQSPKNSKGEKIYTGVEAVIGIAPGGPNNPELGDPFAQNYLAFANSHDADLGVGPNGGVANIENAVALNRHLIYIQGGFHTGWCDPSYPLSAAYYPKEPLFDEATRIRPETQNLVLKTYIGLFLEGVIGKNLAAMRVFRGGMQPTLKSSDPQVVDDIKKRLLVFPYFVPYFAPTGLLASKVQYIFEDFIDDPPTFGQAKDVGTQNFQLAAAYRLRWNLKFQKKPRIIVLLDPVNALSVFSNQPTDSIFLEFDGVQNCHVLANLFGPIIGPTITLLHKNGGRFSCPPIPIPPSREIITTLAPDFKDRTRTVLSTLRVPLGSFGISASTLSEIFAVEVEFKNASVVRDILMGPMRVVLE